MTDQIDARHVSGYLRNEMLSVFKERPKSWQEMSEGQQQDLVARLDYFADRVVERAVQAIASNGKRVVAVKLDKFDSAGVKASFIGLMADAEKLAIWNHQGRACTLVIMDPSEYQGRGEAPQIDKDQPDLPGTADCPDGEYLSVPVPGQPDWPKVAKTLEEGEAPDAGEVEPDTAEPGDEPAPARDHSLLDDDDDGGEAVGKSLINLPDPTKKSAKKAK